MAPKKAPVDAKGAGTKDASVIKRLHQILKTADLEKTTVKNIQKQLEGDLGIDSIKRVEILSAMTERAPGRVRAGQAGRQRQRGRQNPTTGLEDIETAVLDVVWTARGVSRA